MPDGKITMKGIAGAAFRTIHQDMTCKGRYARGGMLVSMQFVDTLGADGMKTPTTRCRKAMVILIIIFIVVVIVVLVVVVGRRRR